MSPCTVWQEQKWHEYTRPEARSQKASVGDAAERRVCVSQPASIAVRRPHQESPPSCVVIGCMLEEFSVEHLLAILAHIARRQEEEEGGGRETRSGRT